MSARDQFAQGGREVMALLRAVAELYERVTFIRVEPTPCELIEFHTLGARVLDQPRGRRVGRFCRTTHWLGERLGRSAAAIAHGFLEKREHKIALFAGDQRQMANGEALAVTQGLPLLEAYFHTYPIELAPHRHRDTT